LGNVWPWYKRRTFPLRTRNCLRKWARPMTVQCVNTAKTEVKGGKMIIFVDRKQQNSVKQNA
jgi:hypothetical protein